MDLTKSGKKKRGNKINDFEISTKNRFGDVFIHRDCHQ